jgi:bifunctional non-homologous end joining protein LigD
LPTDVIVTEVAGQRLKLTNLEKQLFEPATYTKAELISYALEVAPVMLPHLTGRPLTLIRWPDGVGGKMFYTKNKPSWTPDWMPSTFLPWDEENQYLLAQNAAHLVWLANLAALEIHTMNSTTAQIHLPDQFVVDLDPPPGFGFDRVRDLALELREYLEGFGYKPFAKLSGGKGVHLVIPLLARWDYDTVVNAVKNLMKTFITTHPDTTLLVHKNRREDKILLDIYRNHAGNTTIAPYSTRGKAGAPVSMPLTWAEIEAATSAQQYDINAALAYLRTKGDAWAGFRAAAAPLHDQVVAVAAPKPTSLEAYDAKRDFEKTTEPSGSTEVADTFDPQSVNDRFVVHLHDATNLHYDLRLGEAGVLKSWAVPKGLPIEKGIKHLAIQTEDHPAKYIDFQGTIPKEEYGGGQMWIFDTGQIQWLKKSPKSYKFQLIGKSIQGMFSLYQIKDKEWIVERDESVNLEAYTAGIKPMLADSAPKLPDAPDDWLYEIKWDGIRAVYYKRKGEVKLLSRNGRDLLEQFPEFKDGKLIRTENAIIDCELVCLDAVGKPVFSDIISRMHRVGKGAIEMAVKEKPAYLYAFDCMYLDGKKLISYPLTQRREWLEAILRTSNLVRLSDAFPDGQQLYTAARAMGLEGIMAKQKDGRYLPNSRSTTWKKIKFRETFEAHIIGYTRGKGDRVDLFGALHLAVREENGWKYFGKVGTGFDQALLADIWSKIEPLEKITKPIKENIEEEDRTVWVLPHWLCEVTYASFASTDHLREPVFVRMWENYEL